MSSNRVLIRIQAMLLALLLFLCASALGEEDTGTDAWTEEEKVTASGGSRSDRLFYTYLSHRQGGMLTGIFQTLKTAAGWSMDEGSWRAYWVLHPAVKEIAAGNRASTKIDVSFDVILEKQDWSAEELGVDTLQENGAVTEETEAAVRKQLTTDNKGIMNVLLSSLPYDLYWFDKTEGIAVGAQYPEISVRTDGESGEEYVHLEGGFRRYSFTVSTYFRDGAANAYKMNTGIVGEAKAAAAAADRIVEDCAGLSDIEKLRTYKTRICELVSYNYGALAGGTDYGNPWQLIWVFDGDSSTNVVCEGYAKAFKYLCDQTVFNGDITCISVTGRINDAEHMWNIVMMPDGRNYLADITYCDLGYALFLRQRDAGNAGDGYEFRDGGASFLYQYDEDAGKTYSDSDLKLSRFAWGFAYPRQDKYDALLLPSGLTEVGGESFSGTGAQWIGIPEGTKTIGSLAFAGCEKLLYLALPASVTQIADDALENSGAVRVICPEDSAAETWARNNGFEVVLTLLPEEIGSVAYE